MTSITVTEKESAGENLLYVQSASSELFSHADCSARVARTGGRVELKVNCPEFYSDLIKTEIADKVSEIITIKYKIDYFKKNLKVGGLTPNEKEILYASLIAADLEDDKRYTFGKLKTYDSIAIDGVYNFCLKPLKKKWQDVVECIPQIFLSSQLKEFISYLLENKKRRVFIDAGRVYDSHYRRLNRSELLGGESVKIVREVLLSNCGEVDICGEIPKDDEYFLKEYYRDKIVFSNKFIN